MCCQCAQQHLTHRPRLQPQLPAQGVAGVCGKEVVDAGLALVCGAVAVAARGVVDDRVSQREAVCGVPHTLWHAHTSEGRAGVHATEHARLHCSEPQPNRLP